MPIATWPGTAPPIGQLLFRHAEIRIEAELRWHAELRAGLTDPPGPPGLT
jgi:hypothetical protein